VWQIFETSPPLQAFLDQRGEDYDDCQSYSELVSAFDAALLFGVQCVSEMPFALAHLNFHLAWPLLPGAESAGV
jgi:hypothetical protein